MKNSRSKRIKPPKGQQPNWNAAEIEAAAGELNTDAITVECPGMVEMAVNMATQNEELMDGTTAPVTTKPKTCKTPAATSADPIFAAIAEHKAKTKELSRSHADFEAAVSRSEKTHGKMPLSPAALEWAGHADSAPFYDLFNAADRADRIAGMRLAKTNPTTLAGAAALVAYTRRDIVKNLSELSDWCMIALKRRRAYPNGPGGRMTIRLRSFACRAGPAAAARGATAVCYP